MKDPDVARLHAMAEARDATGDPRLAMLYRDAADALDRIVGKRAERQVPSPDSGATPPASTARRFGPRAQ